MRRRHFGIRSASWLRERSSRTRCPGRAKARSAEAFFVWTARIVLDERGFKARYRLDGSDDDTGTWPLRQLDGWGSGSGYPTRSTSATSVGRTRWSSAAGRTADYLEREWRSPSVDWSRRSAKDAHALACVEAGLGAWGIEAVDSARWPRTDWTHALLCLAWPFGLADGIVERVRRVLSPGGGGHRHPDDVYYGGGEWLFPDGAARVAPELEEGDEESARTSTGSRLHAGPDRPAPEQSQDHLLHPETWRPWVDKWGPPPSPLLWSHAMFLDLALALGVEP